MISLGAQNRPQEAPEEDKKRHRKKKNEKRREEEHQERQQELQNGLPPFGPGKTVLRHEQFGRPRPPGSRHVSKNIDKSINNDQETTGN